MIDMFYLFQLIGFVIFSFSVSKATTTSENQNAGKLEGKSSPVLTKVVFRKGKSPNWFHPSFQSANFNFASKPTQETDRKVTEKMDNPYEVTFGFPEDQSDDDFGNVNLDKTNKFDSFGSGSYNQ